MVNKIIFKKEFIKIKDVELNNVYVSLNNETIPAICECNFRLAKHDASKFVITLESAYASGGITVYTIKCDETPVGNYYTRVTGIKNIDVKIDGCVVNDSSKTFNNSFNLKKENKMLDKKEHPTVEEFNSNVDAMIERLNKVQQKMYENESFGDDDIYSKAISSVNFSSNKKPDEKDIILYKATYRLRDAYSPNLIKIIYDDLTMYSQTIMLRVKKAIVNLVIVNERYGCGILINGKRISWLTSSYKNKHIKNIEITGYEKEPMYEDEGEINTDSFKHMLESLMGLDHNLKTHRDAKNEMQFKPRNNLRKYTFPPHDLNPIYAQNHTNDYTPKGDEYKNRIKQMMMTTPCGDKGMFYEQHKKWNDLFNNNAFKSIKLDECSNTNFDMKYEDLHNTCIINHLDDWLKRLDGDNTSSFKSENDKGIKILTKSPWPVFSEALKNEFKKPEVPEEKPVKSKYVKQFKTPLKSIAGIEYIKTINLQVPSKGYSIEVVFNVDPYIKTLDLEVKSTNTSVTDITIKMDGRDVTKKCLKSFKLIRS